ncbi:hypothetical protein DL89DRAFT_290686 [Linderina pennispora]|uniref:LITAF domain-containing protein n=1 Tax=Linderina pennispora TaxID=61395 RepID=A0A1Y1WH89_9FUNG|nr:uncharacterized protein DL89DRAFT_290686 [Linderina pennispora]ORX72867.1 hypothetical protein DL89DRAFT_290686 [Linderina pennispora]
MEDDTASVCYIRTPEYTNEFVSRFVADEEALLQRSTSPRSSKPTARHSCAIPQSFDDSMIFVPQGDSHIPSTITQLCKRCHKSSAGLVERRASTRAGVLALVLCVTFPPLFWLPLVSKRCKEDGLRPSFQIANKRQQQLAKRSLPVAMHS